MTDSAFNNIEFKMASTHLPDERFFANRNQMPLTRRRSMTSHVLATTFRAKNLVLLRCDYKRRLTAAVFSPHILVSTDSKTIIKEADRHPCLLVVGEL